MFTLIPFPNSRPHRKTEQSKQTEAEVIILPVIKSLNAPDPVVPCDCKIQEVPFS
jgi:hypothetical protein